MRHAVLLTNAEILLLAVGIGYKKIQFYFLRGPDSSVGILGFSYRASTKCYSKSIPTDATFFCNISLFTFLRLVPTCFGQDLSRRVAAGRSPAEIVGSNPTGGMGICLL